MNDIDIEAFRAEKIAERDEAAKKGTEAAALQYNLKLCIDAAKAAPSNVASAFLARLRDGLRDELGVDMYSDDFLYGLSLAVQVLNMARMLMPEMNGEQCLTTLMKAMGDIGALAEDHKPIGSFALAA